MQRRRFQTRCRAPGNDPVQCTREGADNSPLRCCNWPNAVWRYEDVMSAKWAILVFNWCSIDKYHSAPSISTRGPDVLACLWLDNRSDGGEQQCTRARFLMVRTWYFIVDLTVIERVLLIISGLAGFPFCVCCLQDLLMLPFLQLSSTSIEVTLFNFEIASVLRSFWLCRFSSA